MSWRLRQLTRSIRVALLALAGVFGPKIESPGPRNKIVQLDRKR